jgi:two-component system, LytTR family, response regulator
MLHVRSSRARPEIRRMLRALIVDDEPLARDELAGLLAGTGRLTVVGKCGNAVEALHALRAERPDVLFLDVEMPGVSGFELLGMLDDDLQPQVVFVTAHDEFAVKAFEESAVDYLLKPVDEARLAKAVAKLEQPSPRGVPAALVAPEITRIPCLAARAIKLVAVADVELVRSSEAGVYVVTACGEFYTELTLSVLEARAHLLRCHKQYLVNVDRIDEISLAENSLAVIKTKSGTMVPVSRRHLTRLRAALGL